MKGLLKAMVQQELQQRMCQNKALSSLMNRLANENNDKKRLSLVKKLFRRAKSDPQSSHYLKTLYDAIGKAT